MSGEGSRSGVLWIPDWPIVAAVLEGELPAHLPSALLGGRGLVAVSAQARRLGLRPGMTRRTAQSLVPDLALAALNPVQQVRAFEPVLQETAEVVADISLLRPGLALVGIEGAAAYYGGEEPVAGELVGAAARAGVEAQVGAASGLLTAILAARASRIIPPGESTAFLDPHPVDVLVHAATSEQLREEYSGLVGTWKRLGLAQLGDIARLEAAEIAARFGRAGVRAHRLARGRDVQLRAGLRAAADLTFGADLDPPVERLDTAAFEAKELAERLHGDLVRRGLACESLRVTARAQNGEELTRAWRLDGLLGATEITDRVRWQLAGWLDGRSGRAPSAPLVRIDLAAEGNYPAGSAQEGLWGRASASDNRAQRAAERAQSLVGPEGVLAPVIQGGRTPTERVRYVVWGDEQVPQRRADSPWLGALPAPLPTTVFPAPVEVELLGTAGAVRMTDRGGLNTPPEVLRYRNRQYPVEGWAGPWPISGRWWEGEVPRVYIQMVSGAGAHLVVGGRQGWWLEGVYD